MPATDWQELTLRRFGNPPTVIFNQWPERGSPDFAAFAPTSLTRRPRRLRQINSSYVQNEQSRNAGKAQTCYAKQTMGIILNSAL